MTSPADRPELLLVAPLMPFLLDQLRQHYTLHDRIHVSDSSYEYHVVPDRTRPLDFEVYQVTDVGGHGTGTDAAQPFLPLYAAYSGHQLRQQSAYFTTRREPRLISSTDRKWNNFWFSFDCSTTRAVRSTRLRW